LKTADADTEYGSLVDGGASNCSLRASVRRRAESRAAAWAAVLFSESAWLVADFKAWAAGGRGKISNIPVEKRVIFRSILLIWEEMEFEGRILLKNTMFERIEKLSGA